MTIPQQLDTFHLGHVEQHLALLDGLVRVLMPYYRSVGEVPRKRHVVFDDGDGGYFHEELMGIDGFSNSSALLYHRWSPSAIVGAEAVAVDRPALTANDPLLPMHLRTGALPAGGDLVTARRRAARQRRRRDQLRRRPPRRRRCTATPSATSSSTSRSGQVCWRRSSARWRSARATTS